MVFKSASDYKKHDHRNVAFQTPVLTNFLQHVVENNPPLTSESLSLLMGFFVAILFMFGFCFCLAMLLASNSNNYQRVNLDIELQDFYTPQLTPRPSVDLPEGPEGAPDPLPLAEAEGKGPEGASDPLLLTEAEGEGPEGAPNPLPFTEAEGEGPEEAPNPLSLIETSKGGECFIASLPDRPPNHLSLTEAEGEGNTVGEVCFEQAPVGENFIWAWTTYFFSWLVPNNIQQC